MARRCNALIIERPGKGETPVRRCGAIAVRGAAYCIAHRAHEAHFDALLDAFGEGWEERVPGAEEALTPRNGWKSPRPATAPAEPVPDTTPPEPAVPPKSKAPSAWDARTREVEARFQRTQDRIG